MRDTVAIGLLKINLDFFSIKTPKKPR